ncbi:hypothetical protein SAMN03159341_11887 [Paenibacillus sp. 1_12]|uniref:hypothetical protein n=1 Tax=Paenibacillus sp. 1_12 TaxID=1566278 RepID=UPI0008EA1B6D|nr:hypothetical protein [Paenibacillus sp. 1_12]SFM15669.1 hypothetical protein SAMN03159341_11887 [Paenibacillus sp. 1_12]
MKEVNAELVQQKQTLETLDSNLTALRQQKDELTHRSNNKKTEHATEKAFYEQVIMVIPEDLRNLQQLELRIRTEEELKKLLDVEWKKAQQQHQECNKRYVKAVAVCDVGPHELPADLSVPRHAQAAGILRRPAGGTGRRTGRHGIQGS